MMKRFFSWLAGFLTAALSVFAGDPSWFPDAKGPHPDAVASFSDEHAAWLDDWALFAALKDAQGGLPWFAWDEPLRRRDPAALARSAAASADRISWHRRAQHVFLTRWSELRAQARD